MLELSNVIVVRGKTTILKHISCRLQAGKIHAVIGPNGAGKSTLLKAIAGQYRLSSGTIKFEGQYLDRRKLGQWLTRMAFMPQDINLDVDLSALEVVLLGKLNNLGMHIDDVLLQDALLALETVGLLHLANASVATLSGGQRQMVLFAQLLMRDSPMLLLDEPVSALDLKHQIKLLDILHAETRRRNSITLAVLHDLNLVAQYADEVVVVGNGGLIAQGTPQSVMNADFVEQLYGIRVDISVGSDELLRVTPLRGGLSERLSAQPG